MSQLIFRGRVKAANGRGFWQCLIYLPCVLVASFNPEGKADDALQVLHTLRWREAKKNIQTLRLVHLALCAHVKTWSLREKQLEANKSISVFVSSSHKSDQLPVLKVETTARFHSLLVKFFVSI